MFDRLDFLFICNGELSFLAHSLKEMLDKGGFNTAKCDIDLKNLEALAELPQLFIVDAEVLLDNAKSRVYLYDKCIESNCKIVLVGDSNTLNNLYDVTASNVIAKSYVRPVNNNEIAQELKKMIESIEEKDSKKRILVVDDSPTFLRLMSEWLENDYNVSVCPSATAAFHIIENNKPNLILLDYEMPICNGAQFLQMLHSEHTTADIPVMFLTSKNDAETVKSLIALKPQGYLLKTQTKDETLRCIAEYFIKEQLA